MLRGHEVFECTLFIRHTLRSSLTSQSTKQYARIDLSPRLLRISTTVYKPIEFELIPFDPLGEHNIPGFVISQHL